MEMQHNSPKQYQAKVSMKKKTVNHSEKLLNFNHIGQCYKPLKKALALAVQQNNQKKLAKPFFIVLGQPESGKNTFIKNAEKIISTQEIFLHNKLPPCILYHCEQAHWIKIPGDYLVKLSEQGRRLLCSAIKKIFKHYKAEIILSGIVVILDIYDMLTRSKFSNDNRLNQINHFLIAFNYIYNKEFSVNFFLNKCDLIPGFFEFFGNRDKEFREQPWGFSIQKASEATLNEEFNALIKKLNEQLIWRLRHETQTEKLNAIKEFPIKIEQLKVRLTPLFTEHFKKLQTLINLQLSDLYLISGRQFNILETCDNRNALDHPSAHPKSKIEKIKSHKNFFIKMPYKKIINDQLTLKEKQTVPRLVYFSFIILCASIVAGCIIFLSHQMSENIKSINKTNFQLNNLSKELFKKNAENTLDLITKTHKLKNINHFIETLKTKQHDFPGSRIIFYNGNSNLIQAKKLREQYITTQWLPAFATHLQTFIREHLNNNPEKSYIALKIYLMLGSKQLGTETDINYINQHLSQILAPATFAVISKLPTAITEKQLPNIKLNKETIRIARTYFSKLKTEQLAYILLFSKIDLRNDIKLNKQLGEKSALKTDADNSIIPAIYTKAAFDQVMTLDIPSAANEALKGNKIIGAIGENTETSTKNLIENLRKDYVKTYIETWQQVISHTNLATSYDLAQFSQQLKLLSSANSPILTFLEVVNENTHFDLVEKQSNELANLNNILLTKNQSDKNSNPLFVSFIAMRHLNKNILNISNATNPDQAAFQQLSQQLQGTQKTKNGLDNLINASNQLPNPLRLWMVTLSNQYHQLLAKLTGNYINKAWLEKIAKPFHKNFATQYPFNSKSTSDINITSFNQFFSRDGQLDQFESSYIMPLLSQNQQGWGVNLSIASTMQIPHDVMQQLKNLAKIQANYFGKKEKSADIEFNATISKLPSDIESVTFSIDNETFVLTKDTKQALNFSWPIANINSKLSITVTNKNKQTKIIEFSGPWAWTKAIDELSINPKINNDQVILSIPSSTKNNAEVILQFQPGNQFNHDLLLNTWMPYWVFKIQ